MKLNLIKGDCLEKMKNIQSDSIDLIVTDPPYKTITGGNPNDEHKRPKGVLESNKGLFKYQKIDMKAWITECYRVLKEETHCYFFTNCLNLNEMINKSLECGFKLHNILVWKKNNCTPSQWYMKDAEYILFLRKGKAKYINNIGTKTVLEFDNILKNKIHPTQKPVDLLTVLIENSSNAGDVILEPFMGSCSTGIACLSTNRNFIGFELDDNYFNISQQRVDTYIKENNLENIELEIK